MWYQRLIEHGMIPDGLLRFGIRRLLAGRIAAESARAGNDRDAHEQAFAASLDGQPVAVATAEANEQHYEVPTAYFRATLGKRLKYSSCFYPEGVNGLDDAEEAMLALTCERADLQNGQDVLELGCGWGSLSLYMAETYPASRITSVSNSRTQKEYIDERARALGLTNLRVITADMNEFSIGSTFARVVSVEMFEHMRNTGELLRRIRGWLRPDGRLFVHIFCHKDLPYLFETGDDHDWMARYFFTGGMMPSRNLYRRLDRDMEVEEQWDVNGRHYERTLNDWLKKMDAARSELIPLFRDTYGSQYKVWWNYWRIFMMACAELFGYRDGREWFVTHIRFKPVSSNVDERS